MGNPLIVCLKLEADVHCFLRLFNCLKEPIQMIYLDNSATTKPYQEILDSFVTVSSNFFGNASSIHQLGGESERLLGQARHNISTLLDVKENEVIFTSGGTEGNNIAIKGIALRHRNRGKHIITTSIEHPSIYEACKELENYGFEITYLPVNEIGLVSVEELARAIRSDTILVSIIHVNNELGSIQPIKEIGDLLENHPKIFFHVDGVQGIGKVPLDLKSTSIDFYTISGHKFHALKGTGVLYVREGVTISPLFHGGVQEMQKRAGTENVPGAVALAKALRLVLEKSTLGIEKLTKLKNNLISELELIPNIKVNTSRNKTAPHIINFSALGIKPEVLIQALGDKGIFVSTKSACSSKLPQLSRIILETGLGNERAASAIRVSMSFDTTEEELTTFINELKRILPNLQEVMG